MVEGRKEGITTITLTAEHDLYEESAGIEVPVSVLNPFRIEAEPPSLSLVEMVDGDSTQISVNLSQIEVGREVTVTVTIQPEESRLTLSTSLLTFSATNLQTVTVTVTATSDGFYTGNGNVMLRLAATGYVSAMVAVEIIEDNPPPIKLKVISSTKLSLVRFASTEIAVSVDVTADLTVDEEGAVRVVGAKPSSLTGGADATQIEIEAVSIGDGTVTFTVSGFRQLTEKAVVSVTVSTPTLTISTGGVNELNIEADQTTADLTVTVSAEGNSTGVTLTAAVTGTTNVASVTPTMITDVAANVAEIFIVESLDEGTTVITFTASHPFYKPAMTTVNVNVTRPVEALRLRIKVFLEGAN